MLSHRLILVLAEILLLSTLQLPNANGDSCYSCEYQYRSQSAFNAPDCTDPAKSGNSSYLENCDFEHSVCFYARNGYTEPDSKPDNRPYTVVRKCHQLWSPGTPPEKRRGGVLSTKECVDVVGNMTADFSCFCTTDKCNGLAAPDPRT